MCKRHSFLLSRTGQVFDAHGITESHSEIASAHGIDQDKMNAYEWQPPKDWPESSYAEGLTKDHLVFDEKASHLKSIESHVRSLYPDMAAWDSPDVPGAFWHERVVNLGGAEYTVYCHGEYSVVEGRYWASGSASVRASGSASVRAFGSASVEACGSASVRAFDSASVLLSAHYTENVSVYIADNAVVIDRMGGGISIYTAKKLTEARVV
jgi:hypothetical protein